jgi:hypothetical protein
VIYHGRNRKEKYFKRHFFFLFVEEGFSTVGEGVREKLEWNWYNNIVGTKM